jgi:hypothetical protein
MPLTCRYRVSDHRTACADTAMISAAGVPPALVGVGDRAASPVLQSLDGSCVDLYRAAVRTCLRSLAYDCGGCNPAPGLAAETCADRCQRIVMPMCGRCVVGILHARVGWPCCMNRAPGAYDRPVVDTGNLWDRRKRRSELRWARPGAWSPAHPLPRANSEAP